MYDIYNNTLIANCHGTNDNGTVFRYRINFHYHWVNLQQWVSVARWPNRLFFGPGAVMSKKSAASLKLFFFSWSAIIAVLAKQIVGSLVWILESRYYYKLPMRILLFEKSRVTWFLGQQCVSFYMHTLYRH